MGYEGLIYAVNATAGVLLALLIGYAQSRARPALASLAGHALLGYAAAVAALLVLAVPLQPVAVLVPFAFACAAWAFAPLRSDPRRALAWGVGAGVALLVGVFSALDLWWIIPLVGLLGGFLSALWQSLPETWFRRRARE